MEPTPLPTKSDEVVVLPQQARELLIKAGAIVKEQGKEIQQLKERVAVLEAESWEVKAVDLIRNLELLLDGPIANLPCESRMRTMDEDTWSTCMYFRDIAYQLLEEKRKQSK